MITGIKYVRNDGIMVSARVGRDGRTTVKMQAPRGSTLDLREVMGIGHRERATPMRMPGTVTRQDFRDTLDRCLAEREAMAALSSVVKS